MMRAKWLPANQAWALLFGDALISIDGRTLFNDTAEFKAAIESRGLVLNGKTGEVTISPDAGRSAEVPR